MHNTFLASTISVRTKGSTPSSFSYYARCSNERNPFVDSTCCSCYCNTMYDAPRMQGYFYNWYGLRQSCLSKRPHCRKPIRSGLGSRYYAQLPVCDRNRSCFCDDMCRLRQGSSLGWRKGGLRQCRVLEEMREWGDDEGVEEVEVVLSFLAEDVCEECDGFRKEKVRFVKKSVVENRDDCEVSSKIRRKKRGDDLGVFKGGHRRGRYSVGSHKKKDDRREEGNRRDDEKEALAWEKHRRTELSEEHGNALQTEIREGREEDTKTLLRKTSQKKEEKKQRESSIRKEDLKASSRIDERREEHEQKVRKEGSSGSSLYSRSADDYYSNIDGELREGGFLEDSFATCGEGDSRRNKIVLQKGEEGNQSCKDYREDHGIILTKERTERASHVGSFLESDFTKKSEKKLVNLSVQDMESGKETSQKDSNLSMTNESGYKKSSDHYARHDDDRQAKSNMKSDQEGNLQHWQTSDEISGQSETRMKYKQFGGMQDSHGDDIIKSHGSQKLLSTRSKVSSGSANSSQKAVGEHRMAVGANKMDDDYQRNSHKIIRISEIQEIDSIKKTSSTLHKFKGSFKQEDNSTNIHSSVNDSAKQQQQSGHVGGLIQSMGESQKLTEKECKSIPKRISNNTIQEEENLNLASVLSLESKELTSQAHTNILKGYNSEKGFNKLVNISFSHSQDSGTIDLKGTSMTKSEIVHEKQQQNVMQYSSGDFQSKKHDLGYDDQDSGTKGPSDEMWNVDNDPSVQEQSREGFQSDSSKASKAIVKGAGRSFWGVISDFVQLRWFQHAESHSSGRKAAGNSSPCHHFSSSETWFSGHEAEENEDADGNKEAKSITQGSYSSQTERKNCSQFEEGPSSFPLEGPIKHVGVNAPFSSKSLERGSQPINIPLYSEVSKKAKSAIDAPEPKQKILQRKNHYIEDRFDEWENVYRLDVEQRRIDEMFMREALLEAQKAADHWEVPVGAVLVHGGKIIARGFNLVEEMRDSTAHAEMICIREASNMLQTWRLSETTLYVTLEPCLMCTGAILQARIDTVVWGAPNKLLGADGSWIRLFPSRDRGNGLELSDKPAAPVHPFHPNIVIRYGVLASECADVMQQFFKLRRKNKDKKPDPSMSPPSCLPVPQQHPHNFLANIHDALNLMFCL